MYLDGAYGCTPTINALPGRIFGDNYKDITGEIRILDTPGFLRTAAKKWAGIYKSNKSVVLKFLSEEKVHAIILLIEDRLDEANQRILQARVAESYRT